MEELLMIKRSLKCEVNRIQTIIDGLGDLMESKRATIELYSKQLDMIFRDADNILHEILRKCKKEDSNTYKNEVHDIFNGINMLRVKLRSKLQNETKTPAEVGLQKPQVNFPQVQLPQCHRDFQSRVSIHDFFRSSVQERRRLESGAYQDYLVRLRSVQTDLALNLPHSVALPDGEEGPRCYAKLLKLRDPQQGAETTRNFIRPPPNRAMADSNCLPPFHLNSAGLLQKSSTPPMTQKNSAVLVSQSLNVSSSNTQSGKLDFARRQCIPSNPASSHILLPSSDAMNSRISGNSGNSIREYGYTQTILDSNYDNTGPPPPYSEVVNQTDINTDRDMPLFKVADSHRV